MWARNLLFISVCLLGLTAVAGGLLSGNRIGPPEGFDPHRGEKDGFGEVVDAIDGEFRSYWNEYAPQDDGGNAEIALRADDLTIARRLSLALTGTIPSLEEIRVLESQPAGNRTEWWVSHLLEDRRYADYVAERLARAYVGTENGPFLIYRRRRFVLWLSDQLHKNTHYDELVRKLIADTGIWTDSPAVNFVTVTGDQNNKNQPDPIRLAGRTSRAFLGLRIDCLQCHDNNLAKEFMLGGRDNPRDGLQSDFHQLAAYFSQTKTSPLGIRDSDGTYEYQYLDADKPAPILPATPYAAELLDSDGTRREQLARWVTHRQNKPFARAIVNRVWALMFGRPLVDPIDNIALYGYEQDDEGRWWDGEARFPPALETLSEDFATHGFDLQRLIRMIAASEVFQLDSRAEFQPTAAHEKQWAVFPLTRLRGEQMAGSIIQAGSLKTINADSHIITQLTRYGQQNQFLKRYGDTGTDEFEDRGGTIPQALLRLNGNLVKERTKQSMLFNAASKIAALAPNDAKAVETAYLTVFTRRPTARERAFFVRQLSGLHGDERAEKLEDLFAVLLNSTEFSWNH